MAVLSGEGCTLSVGGTSIGEVVSIEGPEKTLAEVETTHLGSTAKTYRASGVPDFGTISFQVYFDPDSTTHASLEATDGTELSFVLTMTDATPTTYTFSGIVTSFSYGGMEVESNITADITVRITGSITKA